MTISKVKVWKQHTEDADPDLNSMGFFLSSMEADAEIEEDVGTDANPVDCILTTIGKNSLPMFSSQKIGKVIYNSSDLATFDFTIENGGLFFLYFANCVEVTRQTNHSFAALSPFSLLSFATELSRFF
jgi:hypothetical protein